MLRELSVKNLATVEDVQIDLEPGMLAWTGETGAGKSLLLSALGLLMGARASTELLRAGKTEAHVSGVFELQSSSLRQRVELVLGGPLEDSVLILTRRISSSGRSLSHANGIPVTNSTLRSLSELLLDIHGQYEGRALLEPEHQRRLVDTFGEHEPLLQTYRQCRSHHQALRTRRLEIIRNTEQRHRERELLQFEFQELTRLSPQTGEFDELVTEAHTLANAESIRRSARESYSLLYEANGSAQDMLIQVARKLSSIAEVDPGLASAAADLERIAEETRDLARLIRQKAERIVIDPNRLEQVEDRLCKYRKLATRFRCTPDALEGRLQTVASSLAQLEIDEVDLVNLDTALDHSWQALRKASLAVTSARQKTAKLLAPEIQAQLKGLSLGQASIMIRIETSEFSTNFMSEAPPEHGPDSLEILFSPNPGEPPRPLRKIASGGELSRVTLAVKSVLADADEIPTLIFDEIDTGVGGRLGAVLGRRLNQLSGTRQVLCVTHLPQLACHARHQWIIRKLSRGGRTSTTVRRLSEKERVKELAAMLRGDTAGESTRLEAQAMLAEARAVS